MSVEVFLCIAAIAFLALIVLAVWAITISGEPSPYRPDDDLVRYHGGSPRAEYP